MTPDELERLGKWWRKHWGHFAWLVVCGYFLALFAINSNGKPLLPAPSCYLLPLGLFLTPYLGYLIYKINGRVARRRMRKQDSLARLTKRHEKMLREIRRLEREVSERTEDLPPETIPVSMRGDTYNAKAHEGSYP